MIKKFEEIPIPIRKEVKEEQVAHLLNRKEAKEKLVIFYVEKLEPGIKEAIRLMENEIAESFPSASKRVRLEMANDIIFHQLSLRK